MNVVQDDEQEFLSVMTGKLGQINGNQNSLCRVYEIVPLLLIRGFSTALRCQTLIIIYIYVLSEMPSTSINLVEETGLDIEPLSVSLSAKSAFTAFLNGCFFIIFVLNFLTLKSLKFGIFCLSSISITFTVGDL